MRSVLFHIGFGLAAAVGFLLVLYGLGRAGIHVEAADITSLCALFALTALAFLSSLLITARQIARARPVRVRSGR